MRLWNEVDMHFMISPTILAGARFSPGFKVFL